MHLQQHVINIDLTILSASELERGNRFKSQLDRMRYLASHHALRNAISNHTGLPPRTLEFLEGPQGKPTLIGAENFHFNLSHSEGFALIGISRFAEIGVDIEVLHHERDITAIADMVLTNAEQLALQHIAHPERARAFLTCWTRKEACLKALGAGLNISPNALEVGILGTPLILPLPTNRNGKSLHLTSTTREEGLVASIAEIIAKPLPCGIGRG